jgi:LmbE family N-acetylglucosaminyl deacetylase
MGLHSILKSFFNRHNIYPRRWLSGLFSYPRYLGYIKPYLMAATQEDYHIRRKILKPYWSPKELTTPCGKRILALSPHPDDESIGAGGLLWAHRDVSEIHLILLSRGEKGGALEQPLADSQQQSIQLAAVRKAEFLKMANIVKAKSIHSFDFPDGGIAVTQDAAERLRSLIVEIQPDIVLLPWFLDDWPDHRRANILYSWATADIETMVLAYEVWTLLEPNALFDITLYIEEKCRIIENYKSQLRTVDYISYVTALAQLRAFQYSRHPQRKGAFEVFLALPNREYCTLVQQYYGTPWTVKEHARNLLG